MNRILDSPWSWVAVWLLSVATLLAGAFLLSALVIGLWIVLVALFAEGRGL